MVMMAKSDKCDKRQTTNALFGVLDNVVSAQGREWRVLFPFPTKEK